MYENNVNQYLFLYCFCLSRILLNHLSIDVLRESACDCFHEIISKGMDPVAKTDLVESLMTALESAGVMPPTEVQ